MKFYMIWDKENACYLGGPRGRGMTPSKYPRIYSTARHAASAATALTPEDNGQRSHYWQDGNLIENAAHHRYTADERKANRQKRFEIHEYDTPDYTVVG